MSIHTNTYIWISYFLPIEINIIKSHKNTSKVDKIVDG